MTSKELETPIAWDKYPDGLDIMFFVADRLREIAYQLAVMNEREKKDVISEPQAAYPTGFCADRSKCQCIVCRSQRGEI